MQMLAIAAGERLRQVITERLKHLGIAGRAWDFESPEAGRKHAHHGEGRFVQANHASQNIRIAAEAAHPEAVAENDLKAAIRTIFFRQKGSAKMHGNAQRVE